MHCSRRRAATRSAAVPGGRNRRGVTGEAANTVARLAGAFDTGIGEGTRIAASGKLAVALHRPWQPRGYARRFPCLRVCLRRARLDVRAGGRRVGVFLTRPLPPRSRPVRSGRAGRIVCGSGRLGGSRRAHREGSRALRDRFAAILFTSGSTGTAPVEPPTGHVVGIDELPRGLRLRTDVLGRACVRPRATSEASTDVDGRGPTAEPGRLVSCSTRGVIDAIERYGITMMFAVPAIVRAILDEHERGDGDLSSWVRPSSEATR